MNLKKIIEQIKDNTTLTSLDLGWSNLDNKDVKKITEALKNNTTMTSLDLLGNNIGNEGVKDIAEVLKNNTMLTSLYFGDKNIDPKGVKEIAEALKNNTTLTSLDLWGVDIGPEGSKAIAEALKNNTTLTSINLVCNNIDNESAKDIAETLKNNTALTSLDLLGNNIDVEGTKSIAKALKTNTTLTSLGFGDNNIGPESARVIAQVLKTNSTLTSLNLKRNRIGSEDAREIAEALKNNTTLTSLNLQENNIAPEEQSKIDKLLKRNQFLQAYHSTIKELNSLIYTKDLNKDKKGIAEINQKLNCAYDLLEKLTSYLERYQIPQKALNSVVLDIYIQQGDIRSALSHYQEKSPNISNTSASKLAERLYVNTSSQPTTMTMKAVIALMMQDFKNDPSKTLLPKVVERLLQPSQKKIPPTTNYKATTGADTLLPLAYLKERIKHFIDNKKKLLSDHEKKHWIKTEKNLHKYPPDSLKKMIDQTTALKDDLTKAVGSANIATFESLLTHPEHFTKDPKALKTLKSHKTDYHDTLDELTTKLEARQPIDANRSHIVASSVKTALNNYKRFHENIKHSRFLVSNLISDSRGKAGFFSRFRHTQKGIDNAEKLSSRVENQPENATTRINDFLSNDSTNFHRHSFSAYLLDELKQIKHSSWSDISPDDNKYNQDEVVNQLKP